MPAYSRIEVIQEMQRTGIVPVFYHADKETCKEILHSCYDGGVRVFEFTNRADFAHEVFSEISKYAIKNLPGMMLGIGSIVDPATTALYLQLGASFVVSPVLNPAMAKVCNRRKVAWIPGCGSVTEISFAEECGAEIVKLFPATQVGGVEFVKAVRAPMPWTSIMPSGGVELTEESLKSWFNAGVHCVGTGSKAFLKKPDGTFDHPAITTNLKNAFELIKKIKS